MPYESKYLPSDLLTKIVTYLDIPDTTESMPFSFKLFKVIMLDETLNPVISCTRTIKEKYRDLQDAHYISDSEAPRLDVDRVREYLRKCQDKKKVA